MKDSHSEKIEKLKKKYDKSLDKFRKNIWAEHWEIIVTIILALIIGIFILPQLFR